jgi:hypothetical protein
MPKVNESASLSLVSGKHVEADEVYQNGGKGEGGIRVGGYLDTIAFGVFKTP